MISKTVKEAEVVIQGFFSKVLGGRSAEVDDDFFVLGGSSLDVLQLIAEIQAWSGMDIRVEDLVRASTPRELARTVVCRCA